MTRLLTRAPRHRAAAGAPPSCLALARVAHSDRAHGDRAAAETEISVVSVCESGTRERITTLFR